jgi:hypothetical protein
LCFPQVKQRFSGMLPISLKQYFYGIFISKDGLI